jgi:hypothetical protein
MNLIEDYDDSPKREATVAAKEAAAKPWKDFGFVNGWAEEPAEVVACVAAKHEQTNIDEGPPNRGIDHVVRCQVCRIVYHYDSSD